MANNELSGPVLLNAILLYLKNNFKNLKYTYRFVLLPETIGSIAYISKRLKLLKENINLLSKLDNSIEITFNNKLQTLYLESDKEQLSRVFLNLIKNSIESIQEKAKNNNNCNKKITVELNHHNDHIHLSISDTGVGFGYLKSNIKDILNPYFTTKKNGTGLGLSIVNKIINDHNGNINFIPINDGAKIEILLKK